MPKAYAVVTYRSVADPEKLATYAKLRSQRSYLLVLASSLAPMQ
jgi:hypothetical protein